MVSLVIPRLKVSIGAPEDLKTPPDVNFAFVDIQSQGHQELKLLAALWSVFVG